MIIVPVKDGENIERALKNSRESLKKQVLLKSCVHVSSLTNHL